MKVVKAICVAAIVFCPNPVAAQDLTGTWQWIRVDAAASWFVQQGAAEVIFSKGKVVAHLKDGKYPDTVDFELTGVLTKASKWPTIRHVDYFGTVSAKVTRMASDMSPDDSFRGTYVRVDSPGGKTGDLGKRREFITLSDGFNVLSLQRLTK